MKYNVGRMEAINVAAIEAVRRMGSKWIEDLPDYLRERIQAHSNPTYQFGFTGFKASQPPIDLVGDQLIAWLGTQATFVGQILVAIAVPGKPARNGVGDGLAFWFVNVPAGVPASYSPGESFSIQQSVSAEEMTAMTPERLHELLETATRRMVKMLRTAY